MSQAIDHVESESPERFDEFVYKPVSPLAPVSFVLGLCSASVFVHLFGLSFAVFGIILGSVCLMRILASRGELGGRLLALLGLASSVLCLVAGSAYHAYAFATELPEGYQRVSFYRDISKKEFVVENGVRGIHPDVKQLDGKKILIKGYMYQTRQTEGLDRFTLVKDNKACCFGANPALWDMIRVSLKDGETVNYKGGLVAVGGVFHTLDPRQGGQPMPVYELEVTHFGPAKTSF